VILAAAAGTPLVAIAYDPKVRAVMRQIGLEQQVHDLVSLTAESLSEAVMHAAPGAGLANLRAAARRNATRLVDLLRAGPGELPPASAEWTTMIERALVERARYAEVMETRADDLGVRLNEQAGVLAQATAAAEAAARELAEHKEAAAAVSAELLWLQGERGRQVTELSGQVRDLQALVNRWPVRTYLKAHRAARLAVRRMFIAPLKQVVHVAARRLMSGPSYVFDRYKRARMATYGDDLGGLRAPGEPGLVSIVLPVYNGAALVGEAIDSVLGQTYTNVELIVVDDGSTDDTPAIVDAYAAAHPCIRVVHQENRKLPEALSRGFRLARGEFVTWTSADNRLKPTFLEKMVGCLRRHPAWDMAYANLDVIGEDGGFWRGSPHYEGYQRPPGTEHVALPSTTAELNVVANNSVGAAFLYRSRVPFLLGDYSRHRFIMEDYDYWMRLNALMTLRHADFADPIYDYRFHSRSLTSRWEEFDMLGHRDRMMVFDDFRRDFFLLPMVWVIEGPAATLAAALGARVRAAGHLPHAADYRLADLPQLSVPVVYARVTHDPAREAAPPADLPPGTLTVLITDVAVLPARMHEAWDLCAAIGAVDALPRLARDFQGWLAARDMATVFQAVDARAKSAHLERFEAVVERGQGGRAPGPSASPGPKASVIICTRRWSERLSRTLRAVADQQVAHPYEVIVVDNGVPPGLLASRPAEEQARPRIVVCPVPGLSAARNAGLAEARGEIVCFLDDDALPEPDWLQWVCAAFDEHPATAVVGGHIRLKMPAAPPRALRPGWRKYWSEFLTEHSEYTEVAGWGRYPWGANWSARRDALRAIGGFRSRYGRTGANYWGGEEMVAAALIQRLGGTIAVEPRASVLHDVDPARFTVSHVVRTMVAGYQVYHRAQHDLYVPRQDRVVALLRRLRARDFDRDVGYGRLRWVDAALRKYAQASVVLSELADLRRRARRPVVS
jgi:glycosyltransferase involved in cell wall biosynthesis